MSLFFEMKDHIIRARDLYKVYRLYTKPHYRFLDMFGMLGDKPGAYTEHVALKSVNIDIKRGEKVAFIGRNGAGKSTLLKLITKVITPTSGQIEVEGNVSALLQIGTGFHPDFTGRENVHSYLAQLGVSGEAARAKVEEIIEFAELEEYIDQPIKTYSTGMGARLMFSSSVSITPDILVLDEILGVGDAYFAHKSYERMKQMCTANGTTLLLVTHDIYSATSLCERVIWIDKGGIIMDGAGPAVIKAYEDSIRRQEERRLRQKKSQSIQKIGGSDDSRVNYVILEILAQDNRPQPCPVYFSEVGLVLNGALIDRLPIGPDAFSDSEITHLVREPGVWGEALSWKGKLARPMLNYGSPFHKVSGVFILHGMTDDITGAGIEFEMELWSETPCDLKARAFINGKEREIGLLPRSSGEWVKCKAGTPRNETEAVKIAPEPILKPLAVAVREGEWMVASEPELFEKTTEGMKLRWEDRPGPYILMSEFGAVEPFHTINIPVRGRVITGVMIIGVLSEDSSHFIHEFAFEKGSHERELEILVGPNHKAQMVIYSGSSEPLEAVVSWPDGIESAVKPQTVGSPEVGSHGTGVITVTGARTVNGEGVETHHFVHGAQLDFLIAYKINKPDLRERAQVVIALLRDGVNDVCRFITRDLLFDHAERPSGVIRLVVDRLALAPGLYSVTIMIARENYYDEEQPLFFTINPGVYNCVTRIFDIIVGGGGLIASGTIVVEEGKWSLEE